MKINKKTGQERRESVKCPLCNFDNEILFEYNQLKCEGCGGIIKIK